MNNVQRDDTKFPERIRVEWTPVHIGMIFLAFMLWPVFWYFNPNYCLECWPKLLSILGLFLNSIGATIATLKPPVYGIFYDGGELQRRCEALASRHFKVGMTIVAFGFVLQVIKEII